MATPRKFRNPDEPLDEPQNVVHLNGHLSAIEQLSQRGLNKTLTRHAEQMDFLNKIGGMSHLMRDQWNLATCARLRKLLEADLYAPYRTAMPPELVAKYLSVIKAISTLEDRLFKQNHNVFPNTIDVDVTHEI